MRLDELQYYIGVLSYVWLAITLACLCWVRGWGFYSELEVYIMYNISIVFCYRRVHEVSKRRRIQNDNT